MELGLLAKLSGTLANAATVLLGTLLGLFLRGKLPERMGGIMVQGVGLTTLFIGVSMAGALSKAQGGAVDGVVLGLLALVLGGLLGEWARLEEGLEALGERLKRAVRGGGGFTEGFVAASLLFCVGPMTLVGALQNGLTGDPRLLLLKATLDGLSAIALTASFGVGVGMSVLVILLYQGGVALLAGVLAQALPDPAQDPRVLLVTGVGGLMILGIGINLLGLGRVRVASFLPALLLAPILFALAEALS
ncbi:DUF554 domain-containing protein [Thermus oshimai]|jgi:uncharacterized membrane protein YqgA involved in biofilm formation|uniref:Uncharacterized membrane protein, possible Na+ channel or pump n=1 Tax=Thermus oshimai JL-2 TaxID=751945 RepID=K7QVI9_THEOS|nr:DUF554 domain-containing protein [Thermus oshimai]AFV76581.1 uncharacterized membrane protein, possible Na+ channel or pump [Thermus oshimai JL-2]